MREATIQELLRRYEVQERSARIAEFLSSTRGARIERTLRSHRKAPIVRKAEIDIRDNLDELLAGCSLLEILSYLSPDPPDLPAALVQTLQTTLMHPDVRRYYEHNYPIVLPQLFRDRLLNRLPASYHNAPAPNPGASSACLVTLLDLDRRQSQDQPLVMFLALLDGYRMNGWWLEDVLKEMSSKEALARVLQRDAETPPGEPREPLAVALEGFDSFLRYAEELHDLLLRTEGELHGSLAWLAHSYFYGESAETIGLTFRRVRKLLDIWADGSKQGLVAASQAEHLRQLFKALRDRSRWTRPAERAGLAPYLRTLDP
jgi:hypothetical protein